MGLGNFIKKQAGVGRLPKDQLNEVTIYKLLHNGLVPFNLNCVCSNNRFKQVCLYFLLFVDFVVDVGLSDNKILTDVPFVDDCCKCTVADDGAF